MFKIKYRSLRNYKYQLLESYEHQLHWPALEQHYIIDSGSAEPAFWCALSSKAVLKIRVGYAWDGASGPTRDTPNTMRASLVHDALYQLIREAGLPYDPYRRKADHVMYNILKQDGMSEFRARLWLISLRGFAGWAARPNK